MATREQIQELTERLLSGQEHLSFSSLKNFGESPKAFVEYKLREKVQTDAMLFGDVVHCLVLEPEDFDNRYFLLDDTEICKQIGGAKPRGTKVYGEWKEKEYEKANGKIEISPQMSMNAKTMANNIHASYAANGILKRMVATEIKIEWEYGNFRFKGAIDGEKPETFIVDLKTCADASPQKFQRDIIKNEYHVQAAMYLKARDNDDLKYYIIAADNSGGVSAHLLDERLLRLGQERYDYLIEMMNVCILKQQFYQNYEFYSPRMDGVFVAEKPAYLY